MAAVEGKQNKSRKVAVPEQSQEPENPSSRASNAEEFKQTELLMILLSLSPSLNNGTSVRRPRGEVMESWISKRKPLGGPQGGTTGSVGKQRSIFFLFYSWKGFFLTQMKKKLGGWGVCFGQGRSRYLTITLVNSN